MIKMRARVMAAAAFLFALIAAAAAVAAAIVDDDDDENDETTSIALRAASRGHWLAEKQAGEKARRRGR